MEKEIDPGNTDEAGNTSVNELRRREKKHEEKITRNKLETQKHWMITCEKKENREGNRSREHTRSKKYVSQ